MKKILFFLSIAFINVTVLAQNFTPVTYDSTFYGSSSDSDFYGYINIDNDQGVSQSMYWKVDTMNLPSDWEFSVCDQDVCNPIGVTEDEWSLPWTQGYLNMHFYPNGQDGEGFVTLLVHTYPSKNQEELITFRGSTLSAASLETALLDKISVYPNPFDNELIVSGEAIGTSYKIYDVQGKEMKSGRITDEGAYKVDMLDLNEGIYFINIQRNETVVTRKIVKK